MAAPTRFPSSPASSSPEALNSKLFVAPLCTFVPPSLGDPAALEQPPGGSELWGSVDGAGVVRPRSATGNRNRSVLWIQPADDAEDDSAGLRPATCSNEAYAEDLQQARQLLLLHSPSQPHSPWGTSSSGHAGSDAPNNAQVSEITDQYSGSNGGEGGLSAATRPPGGNERHVAVVNLLTQGGFRLMYFLIKYWASTETKHRSSRGEVGGPGDAFAGGEDEDDELGAQQGANGRGGEERSPDLQRELLQLLAQVVDGTRRLVKSCLAPGESCTDAELALQLLVLRRFQRGAASARRCKTKTMRAWATDDEEAGSASLLGIGDLREDSGSSSSEEEEEEVGNEDEGEEVGLANRDSAERQLRGDGSAGELKPLTGQRMLSGQDALDVSSTMRSLVLCVSFFADWLLRSVIQSIDQQAAAFGAGGAGEAGDADTFGSERLRAAGAGGGRWGRGAAAANTAVGRARNSKVGTRQKGGSGSRQPRGSSSVVSSSKRADSTVRRRARRQRALDSDEDDSGILMSEDEAGENEPADEQKTAAWTEHGSSSASDLPLQLGGNNIWDVGLGVDKLTHLTPRSHASRGELPALLSALGNLGRSESMWRAFAAEVGGEQKEENLERLQLVRALLRPLALLYDEEKLKVLTRLPLRDACFCLYVDGASVVSGSSKVAVVEPLKQTAKAALQKVLQQIERRQQQKRQKLEELRRRGNDRSGEEALMQSLDAAAVSCNEEQKEQQDRGSAAEPLRREVGSCGSVTADGASAELAKADDRDSDEEEEGEEGAEEHSWQMQLDSVVLKPECRALIEIFASPELRDGRLPVRLARELAQQLREQLLLCGAVERATLAQRQIFSMTAGSLEELARVLPHVWLKEKQLLVELFAADAYHIRKALLECLRSLLLHAHRVLDLNEAEDMEASTSAGGAEGKRYGGSGSDSETEDRRSWKRMRLAEADSADEDEWWQQQQQPDVQPSRREGSGRGFGGKGMKKQQASAAAGVARRRFWAAHRADLLRLLLERLQDKTPLARSWALKVLADLIGEKEALPPAGVLQAVRAASKRLLDKSTLVRGAAFSVLAALLHVALKQLTRFQQQQQRARDEVANDTWQPFLFLLISLPGDWEARRKAIRDQKLRSRLRDAEAADTGRKTSSRAAGQQVNTDGDLPTVEEAAAPADEEGVPLPARGASGAASHGEDDAKEESDSADPDELLLCAEDALSSALQSCEDLLLSTSEGDQKAALRFIVDACVTLQLRRPQLLSSLHHALRLAFSSSGGLVTLLLQEFRRLFLDPLSLEQQQQRLFNQQLLRRAWQRQLLEQLRREQETLRRLQRKQQQLQQQAKADGCHDTLQRPQGHHQHNDNKKAVGPTGEVSDPAQCVRCPLPVLPGCVEADEEAVAVGKSNRAPPIPRSVDAAAAGGRAAANEAGNPAKTDAALQLAAAGVAAAAESVRALKEQLECMQRAPCSTSFQQLLMCDGSDTQKRGGPYLTAGAKAGRGDSLLVPADAAGTAESIFRFGACKLIELAHGADVSVMACIEKLLRLAFNRDDGVQQQHQQLWALKHTADALFSLALTPGSGPRCIRLGERSSRCALGLLRLLFEASRHSVAQQQHHQQDMPGSLCGTVGQSASRGGPQRSSSSQLSPQKKPRDPRLVPTGVLSQVVTGAGAAAAGTAARGPRLHSMSNAQFVVLVKAMRRALGEGGGYYSSSADATPAAARGDETAADAVTGSSTNSKRQGEPDFCTFTEMCWIITALSPDRRSARAAVVALELLVEHYETTNTQWFAAAQAVVELTFTHCAFPERLWTRVLSRLLSPLVRGSAADRSALLGASGSSAGAFGGCGYGCSVVNNSRRSAAGHRASLGSGAAVPPASFRPSLSSNCDFSTILGTPLYENRCQVASCLNEEALQVELSPAPPGAQPPAALTSGVRTGRWSAADGMQLAERASCGGTAEEAAAAPEADENAAGRNKPRRWSPGPGQSSVDAYNSGCSTVGEQEIDVGSGVGEAVPLAGPVAPGGGAALRGELQRHQPVSLWMLAHLVFLAGHIALRVCVLLEEQHAEAKRERLLLHHVRGRSSRPRAHREGKKSKQTAHASKKRRVSGERYGQQDADGGRPRDGRRNGSGTTDAAASSGSSPRKNWAGAAHAQQEVCQREGHTPPRRRHQRRAPQSQRQWDGGTSSVAEGAGEEDSEEEEEEEEEGAEGQGSAGIGNDVEMNMGMQTKEEEEAELFAHVLETEVVGSGLLGHPLKRLILVAALEPQRLLRPSVGGSRSSAALPLPSPSPVSVSRQDLQQSPPVNLTSTHAAAVEEKQEMVKAAQEADMALVSAATEHDAQTAAASTAGLMQQQNAAPCSSGQGTEGGATPTTAASAQEDSPQGLEELHAAAVVALCKYATVSRSFCESRICQKTSVLHALVSLLFSRPTTGKSRGSRNTRRRLPSTLRQTLLICYGDLTCRHPNAVEPYNDIVFCILRDEDAGVRHTAVQVLTHLVMNGMVKAKGRLLVFMLLLLSDRDQRIAAAAETFFYEVDRKAAYAVLNAFPELLSALAAACCCTGSPATVGSSSSISGRRSSNVSAAVRSASSAQQPVVAQQQELGKSAENAQQGSRAKQAGGGEQLQGSERTDPKQRNKETDEAAAADADESQLTQEDVRPAEAHPAHEHQRLLKFLLQFVKHHRHTETLVERIAQRIATLPLPAAYTAKKQRFPSSSGARGSAAAAPSAGDLAAAVTQQQREKGRFGGLAVQLPLDPLAAMALLSSPEETSLHRFGASFKDSPPDASSSAGHQQGSHEEHQTVAAAGPGASQQRSREQHRYSTPQHLRAQQRLTGGEVDEQKEQPGVHRETAAVETAGQSLQSFDTQERERTRRLYAVACRRTFFEALVAVCLSAHSFEKCLRKVVNSWPLLRTAVALPEEEGGGAEQLKELLKKAAALLRSAGGTGVAAAGRSATATTGVAYGGADVHSDAEDRSGETTTIKRSGKGAAAAGGAAASGSHDAMEAIRELMEELHKKLQAATKEEEPAPWAAADEAGHYGVMLQLSENVGEAEGTVAISSGY